MIEHYDPDIDVLTDYCMGELSTADAEEFERRLREEEGLLERLWPALRIHYGDGPDLWRAAMRERYPDEAAALDEIVKASGITPRGRRYPRFEKFLPPEMLPPTPTAGSRPSEDARSARTTQRPRPWVNFEFLQVAASVVTAVLLFAVVGGGGGFAYRHMRLMRDTKVAWQLAHRGTTRATRAPEVLNLPGISQVVLDSGSRAWAESAPWSTGSMVKLEGGATVHVESSSRAVWVVTGAGEALLMPGDFRVVTEDSSAMQVTVEHGSAEVSGGGATDWKVKPWIPVGPGQHVRVTR